MDFYRIKERSTKNGVIEIYPDFKVCRSKDLMVRGRSFYAIWDEKAGLWSTDEYDVQRLIDEDLMNYRDEVAKRNEGVVQVKTMGDFSSNSWMQFRNYVGHISDSSHQLDESLVFSNSEVKKTDYVSRRLPYPLQAGDISAWDEIVSVLYDPEERAKIEWAIGAVVAGDSKTIQKFLVFYGAPGTGKGTVMNVILKLFAGYYITFDAKALTASGNAFSTEVFKSNPLVAVQHDGDLSRIEDNSKLNSIVSHEDMTMNEKYKPSYTSRVNAFLFMGTNKAVKITDSMSGIIRRLIDVRPSGRKIAPRRYQAIFSQIDFELGAIAHHCLEVYREMGKDYYDGYRPIDMMMKTDVFFNFIEDHIEIFKEEGGITLNRAHDLYKQFCKDSLVEYVMPRYKFREELKSYFGTFEERAVVNNIRVRSWYTDFLSEKFQVKATPPPEPKMLPLVMDEIESLFDNEFGECLAQYANAHGTPIKKWSEVETKLKDIDTRQLHYVKAVKDDGWYIVIDFDLTDEEGNKSVELNIAEASKWPPTYAEFSKSGAGIHLHYKYDGDPSELSRSYSDGIEVKVFTGDSSLRRQLSKCNNVPIATISSGLPLKEKKVTNSDSVKSEKALRDLILRNLRKEIHPGTKSSVDFIHKILEDAYMSGLAYDVTNLRPKIMAFANNSTNQSLAALKLVQKMRFHSEPIDEQVQETTKDDRLAFFDVEVFPNLFVVSWKFEGSSSCVRMINPTAQQIEELMTLKLVGFNCRRYDNHILYARYMGYSLEQLYKLSQKIISGSPNALFREAYNISYADIYDYTTLKQSLKKYQLMLGLRHKELGLPWDQPVPANMIDLVAEYCDNDVITTEQVHIARKQDFVARQILADLSGLSVNATTQQHTSKIVFGEDSRPQEKFVYTDLSDMFPGYVFERGKSTYRGEETGEGGYVYSEPGMYTEVALLDVESMHPTSIEALDLFGEYTEKFSALKKARMAIKHRDYDTARKMLGGKLAPYLDNEDDADALSDALKIVINIVYGLTSAKFDNSFRDPRNIDNIVAKRGALFMVDLKHAVQEKGFTVAHIKTDSIKIPNATKEIIDFVMEFAENYGYTFKHEATYEKMCLVNNAVYIAKTAPGRKPSEWQATGAQFAHPYVFKKLFSKERLAFNDLCETKTVTTALYLDMDEESEITDVSMALQDTSKDTLRFVGKAGSFCPILPGRGGGRLLREKDGAYHSASGASDYRWEEAEVVLALNKEDDIDMSYFKKLEDNAKDTISKFGDFEWFTSTDK